MHFMGQKKKSIDVIYAVCRYYASKNRCNNQQIIDF